VDAGDENTSHYRALIPAKYLERAGHVINLQVGGTITNLALGPEFVREKIEYGLTTETVLLERVSGPDRITKLRLDGAKRIVLTFDDNYGLVPKNSPSYRYWHGEGNYPKFLKALGMVDLVIVPSKTLCNDFRKYCKEIKYVPNYLDREEWGLLPRVRGPQKVIGWGGTMEHSLSWKGSPVSRALVKIYKEYGDRVKFLFVGKVADAYLGDMCFESVEFVPIERWPKLVNTFDIGLAPLAGEYDRRRSCLKAVEYATLGIPYVCSFLDPYTQAHNISGGVMVGDRRSGEYWYAALSRMIEEPSYYDCLSRDGKAWGETFFMDKHIPEYEEILWGNK